MASTQRVADEGYLLQHKGAFVQLAGWAIEHFTLESVLILDLFEVGGLA